MVLLFGVLYGKITGKSEKKNYINKADRYKSEGNEQGKLRKKDTQGNSGLNSKNVNSVVATDSDGTMDKRYEKRKIESKLLEKEEYEKLKNKKLSWWIKRNKEHVKSECEDSINLKELGAYYVDDRVYDKNNEKYGERVMYLTFDCGYENGLTSKILDILKKYDVPACFFVTKTYIRDNIELTKRMKAEGHQVGNHSCTHPSFPDKSYEEIIKEIEDCTNYMKEATGYEMDPYFRPPMGEYSERVLRIANDMGYKNIFWSIVYFDYDVNKQPGREYVINHFDKFHHNGAIILMHNVSTSNLEALETVLKNMKEKGYRFASLNEFE